MSYMRKSKALELLGGSVASAAKAVGVSYQAVEKWPDMLPGRIADRVVAALARTKFSPAELGIDALDASDRGDKQAAA